jgi:membrane protein
VDNLLAIWHGIGKVVQRFRADRCTRVAGALSFTTLLALVPLTAVMFAIFSRLPGFESWMAVVQEFLYGNFVPAAGETVSRYLRMFAANADRLGVWGLFFFVLTSLMVMATIERVFNDIWHVPLKRRRLHRYLAYGALLLLGPVLIGMSLSFTYRLFSAPLFGRHAPLSGLRAFVLDIFPVLFQWAALWLLYTVVPNARVSWRHSFIGSLASTVLFEIAKRGFAVFVKVSSYKAIYGAVAALPVFLIWIYLSWTIVLLGAVTTATLPEWRRPQAVRKWRKKSRSDSRV